MEPSSAAIPEAGTRRSNRACCECATAKAKCIRESENISTKCVRCCQLKKECTVQVAAVRKRRCPGTSRIAQLEQRMDGLVTLIGSSQPIPQNSEQLSLSPEPTLSLRPASVSRELGLDRNGRAIPESRGQNQLFIGQPTPGLDWNWMEAETLLSSFQTQRAWYIPFVTIPRITTAQYLHQNRPFLWRAIIAVSDPRDEKGKEMMGLLISHILVDGENSLDLLQALLVYTSWSYYSDKNIRKLKKSNHKIKLIALLHLALALVVNLGLNKTQHPTDMEPQAIDALLAAHSVPREPESSTLEEKRTLLGCFYLTSAVSAYYKNLIPLKHSLYIEQCCQALIEAREYQNDLYLVYLVKLQHIVERIGENIRHERSYFTWDSRGTVGMVIKSFQSELENFKTSLPPELRENTALLLHYYSAEIYLYEIGFEGFSGQASLQWLELLNSCLLSTKSWFDTYFSVYPWMYFKLTFVGLLQVQHALLALYRLSFEGIPGWDTQYVQEVVVLPNVLDLVAQRMEEAAETRKINRVPGDGEDFFSILALRIRLIKNWCMNRSETHQNATSLFDEWMTGDIFGTLNGSF